MNRKNKVGCLLLALGVACFISIFVIMITVSPNEQLKSSSLHLKCDTTGAESEFMRFYGTIEAKRAYTDVEIEIRYYLKDGGMSKTYTISIDAVEKGTNEIEIITDVLADTVDTSEEYRPSIYSCRSASLILKYMPVVIGLFVATAVLWVMGGTLSSGGRAKSKKAADYEKYSTIASDKLDKRIARREEIDVFGEEYADGAETNAAPSEVKRDRALDTDNLDSIPLPWEHGAEARFDSLNYTAMVTVHSFDAEKFFYESPTFYDEIRDGLKTDGRYKVVDGDEKNDFLFACEMSRTLTSWEEILRVVCYDCYDGALSENEGKIVDRGSNAELAALIRATADDREEIMPRFYAVYDRLKGSSCTIKYASFLGVMRSLSGGNFDEFLTDDGMKKSKKETARVRENAPAILRSENPEPTKPVVPEQPQPAPRPNAVELLNADKDAATQLFSDYVSVRRIDDAVRETGVFPEDAPLPKELSPEDWLVYFAAGKKLLIAGFYERLDKKTVKAFRKADIEEKGAIFRDLPSADRPEVQEGFFYAVYDELGGVGEEVRRDRFERLIKSRYE